MKQAEVMMLLFKKGNRVNVENRMGDKYFEHIIQGLCK